MKIRKILKTVLKIILKAILYSLSIVVLHTFFTFIHELGHLLTFLAIDCEPTEFVFGFFHGHVSATCTQDSMWQLLWLVYISGTLAKLSVVVPLFFHFNKKKNYFMIFILTLELIDEASYWSFGLFRNYGDPMLLIQFLKFLEIWVILDNLYIVFFIFLIIFIYAYYKCVRTLIETVFMWFKYGKYEKKTPPLREMDYYWEEIKFSDGAIAHIKRRKT